MTSKILVEGKSVAPRAVIVDAVRTPIGRARRDGGTLSQVHPASLLATAISALLDRAQIDSELIDDVYVGCVTQAGEQASNVARWAWLAAGGSVTVPGTTIDRQCGSSQQALHFAVQAIESGHAGAIVVGGVESMSRVPMFSAEQGADPRGPAQIAQFEAGFVGQGISAELVAARWGLDRSSMDLLAFESHQRAAKATAAGLFRNETVPVRAPGGSPVAHDEGVRPDTSLEALASLRPAFADEDARRRFAEIDEWRVTAGNSSQISDGAAALLVCSDAWAERFGLVALAAVQALAVCGSDPIEMLTGVIPATRLALRRARMRLADVDLFEVNEAFACVPLAWARELSVDPTRMNVHGGAIALGHPLGASGARLMTTLVHALAARDAEVGLQTMCEAGGMANATILTRIGD